MSLSAAEELKRPQVYRLYFQQCRRICTCFRGLSVSSPTMLPRPELGLSIVDATKTPPGFKTLLISATCTAISALQHCRETFCEHAFFCLLRDQDRPCQGGNDDHAQKSVNRRSKAYLAYCEIASIKKCY